jgi:hypothetical protein
VAHVAVEVVRLEDVPLLRDDLVAHEELQLELLDRQVLALDDRAVDDLGLLELHVAELQVADAVHQLQQLAALVGRHAAVVPQLRVEPLGALLVLAQPLLRLALRAAVLLDGLAELLALAVGRRDVFRRVGQQHRDAIAGGPGLGRLHAGRVPVRDDDLALADLDGVLHVLVLEFDQGPPELHALPEVLLHPGLHLLQRRLVRARRLRDARRRRRPGRVEERVERQVLDRRAAGPRRRVRELLL